MKICTIIPAHNEEKAIGGLISKIKGIIPDVLVVNDGSSDNTEQVAKGSGASVITIEKNSGKGNALHTGFEYAISHDYDAVITIDGDGQHAPEDIDLLLKTASSESADVVVGNRMANPKKMPFLRVATNFGMSLIISAICRQRIPDTQCGFRLIKCEVLKNIKLISSRYEIESELLIRASKAGYKIKFAPISTIYAGELSEIHPITDTRRFFAMLCKIVTR